MWAILKKGFNGIISKFGMVLWTITHSGHKIYAINNTKVLYCTDLLHRGSTTKQV